MSRPIAPALPFLPVPSTTPPDSLVRDRPTSPVFDDVFATFGAALWRLTGAYEREPAAREDLYQEILIALWRALPRFRGEASLATFVFRVGHNRAMTHCARSLGRREREQRLPETLADPGLRADDHAEHALTRARVHEAVVGLPITLAQPMMLQLEGLSQREIAETLGITENNTAVRLSRARVALRAALGGLLTLRDQP